MSTWGEDAWRPYPETHWESKYGIYRYGVQGGGLVEIIIDNAPEVGTPEIDINHFKDPDFRVINVVSINSNNV